MDFWSIVVGSLIAGVVGAAFSIFQYYAIQRREQRRDAEFDRLRTELATLKEGRVVEMERRLNAETAGRKAIHDQIDQLGEKYQLKTDAERQRSSDREVRAQETVRLERMIERQAASIAEQNDSIGALKESVASLATSVRLLVDDKIRRQGD